MPNSRRKHKYGVAPKEDRTLDGIVYHSKAEMIRAGELKLLMKAGWFALRQVPLQLTDDDRYVVDFFVQEPDGCRHFEDVKGVETPAFRRVRRLWLKYGPGRLTILKRKGDKWETEHIQGPSPSQRRCF